jgi:hypothetical protein
MEEPEDAIQLPGFVQLNPVDFFSGVSTRGLLTGALVLAN